MDILTLIDREKVEEAKEESDDVGNNLLDALYLLGVRGSYETINNGDWIYISDTKTEDSKLLKIHTILQTIKDIKND